MPFLELPDGIRLYHEVHGPPDRSWLVLLEGMGGAIPGWRRNIPRLARRYRVLAVDSRGNGRSDPPTGPMGMDSFVADTVSALDALDIGTGHVYGQSFGGMIALQMGLTHPERVRSLVLGCTHAGRARRSKLDPPPKVPKDRPYLALYAERFAREHPDHVAEDVRVGSRSRQDLQAGRRQWQAIERWDAWDRLGDVRCPTLVLHGTEDRLISADNARRMAAAIPGAELRLLEGAGHVYHSEQPEAADEAVLSFLDRVEARGEERGRMNETGRGGP